MLVTSSTAPRVLYAPPASYFTRRVEDADGRPDLRLQTQVGGNHDLSCGGYVGPEWSPEFVAHSLPDGSFSLHDRLRNSYL